MGTVLKTEAITMRFGGVTAVNELKLDIQENKIVALIGPNGAGKTTAFNMITGVYTPTEGKVKYTCPGKDEVDITGKRPSDIAKMGIARTFQNIRLFKDLSVYEFTCVIYSHETLRRWLLSFSFNNFTVHHPIEHYLHTRSLGVLLKELLVPQLICIIYRWHN